MLSFIYTSVEFEDGRTITVYEITNAFPNRIGSKRVSIDDPTDDNDIASEIINLDETMRIFEV